MQRWMSTLRSAFNPQGFSHFSPQTELSGKPGKPKLPTDGFVTGEYGDLSRVNDACDQRRYGMIHTRICIAMHPLVADSEEALPEKITAGGDRILDLLRPGLAT